MIVVVGMGRSGEAAVRLALKNGQAVRLLDQNRDAGARQKASVLRALGADVLLGEHDASMLEGAREMIVSPGVPRQSPVFGWAKERGLAVMGEMEWAARQFEGRIVAVTGTNGKTTTTALIAHLLQDSGISAAACGNIGTPLSQVLLSGQTPSYAVAEISSFQLETVRDFHPAIALFLNFTPDHLDRHADLEEYWNAKLRIFSNQDRGDWALIHADLKPRLAKLLQQKDIAFATFGMPSSGADITLQDGRMLWRHAGTSPLCLRQDIRLLGDHNVENACAAAAAAFLCGLGPEAIAPAMARFHAVPHRLQPAGACGGVRFINDSKATNADSLAVALKAFDQPVVLIAGGRHKNQDFRPLAPLIGRKVKAAVLIGEGAAKMRQEWAGATRFLEGAGMAQAVQMAWQEAQPGGVVLLSPACASFDMFRNYEERGDVFMQCVRIMEERGAHDAFAAKV